MGSDPVDLATKFHNELLNVATESEQEDVLAQFTSNYIAAYHHRETIIQPFLRDSELLHTNPDATTMKRIEESCHPTEKLVELDRLMADMYASHSQLASLFNQHKSEISTSRDFYENLNICKNILLK
jgi:hypothetical protein